MYELLSKEEMQALLNSAAFQARIEYEHKTSKRPNRLHGSNTFGRDEDGSRLAPLRVNSDGESYQWGDNPLQGETVCPPA